jgi:mono/diheme cytochrome c family protein
MTQRIYAAAVTILALASVAPANAASIENGRRIVQQNCAVCHAVGVRGESRNREAPPFRELHQRYPVEMLAEALAEGILSGHPAMPQFTFPPREIEDIIAYLQSVQTQKAGALRSPAGPAG